MSLADPDESADPAGSDQPRGPAVITLMPHALRFEAAPEETVMRAARRAGLRMTSSCRNGTCRACLSRCLEGRVSYRIDWPGVTREEQAEGWVLPCIAYAEGALVLDTGPVQRLDAASGPSSPAQPRSA